MHILFVVPYPPSPIRVRPYNLIQGLSARGHRVTVLTLWTDQQELDAVEELKRHCAQIHAVHLPRWRPLWNCLRALPSSTPLQAVYCWHPGLDTQSALLDGPSPVDIVHVEHLRGARYGVQLGRTISAHKLGIPVVWDSVDCISYLFEQAMRDSRSLSGKLITRLELQRTRKYEGWLTGQFDQVLVTSDVDKAALTRLAGPQPTISVVPNGVDQAYFSPADGPREPATLVITGKMSYHANVTTVLHLVHDIMPHVWQARPEVKLWIVGKDPPRAIRALHQPSVDAARTCIVTGTVPDLRPYLQRATLAVTPIPYGAGIQNKVLEAMACGTPVVTSSQACSALRVRDGEHLLIADGPEAFAQAVRSLLDDPVRQRQLGEAGRRYVEEYHDWQVIAENLESIYQGAIEAKRR